MIIVCPLPVVAIKHKDNDRNPTSLLSCGYSGKENGFMARDVTSQQIAVWAVRE
jgi:hypothetical protein